MAKLFTVTAVQQDLTVNNPPCVLYLNPIQVIDAPSVVYTDSAGDTQIGTQILYSAFRKNFPHKFVVTEPPSTVIARMNAAPTTDVHQIALTVIDRSAPNTGYIAQNFKTATNVNTDDIWLVRVFPPNSGNAQVVLQNQVRTTMQTIRTEETAAAIATAANN